MHGVPDVAVGALERALQALELCVRRLGCIDVRSEGPPNDEIRKVGPWFSVAGTGARSGIGRCGHVVHDSPCEFDKSTFNDR